MDSDIIILQINTALNEASISISRNGVLISEMVNGEQHEHAGFIQPAIKEICSRVNVSLHELSGVAVMNGPGSYTGLRVGLSSAKGICFALGLPLICINTLDWMAFGNLRKDADLVCPMIDARRMEVFTAVYDQDMNLIMPAKAMVLDIESFSTELLEHSIQFCGTGATKWKTITNNENACFREEAHDAGHFSTLAYQAYINKQFADLINSEPYYLKAFYTTQGQNHP
ncbi:MAG: tRNA (adenosine(37)-N6)-threonylcarbamoyltransferase complex dimerization subunit type 1 TsaB [bacterium]|jgi:tRNA threonylcarbamoyladenosine biosynthesis protein TsaB